MKSFKGLPKLPKVKARVKQVGYKDGGLFALLQFNEKAPKKDDLVTVKWGSTRTLSQNALYWSYLNWLIYQGGLRDHGHFSADALHMDLKSHFLGEKIMDKGQWKVLEEPTTTTMGKSEFGEYLDKINIFVQDFFGISTAAFWEEYSTRTGT